MTDPLVLVAVGIAVGTFGTIVGAGGGFLVVPYLLLAGGMPPQLAIGTSLTMVFFNALSGTAAFLKQRRIDFPTGIKFALATVPGAIAGSYMTVHFTSRLFNIMFGLLLLILAVSLLLRGRRPAGEKTAAESLSQGTGKFCRTREFTQADGTAIVYSFNEALGVAISFGVGFLSSLFGIGGGIIHVPLMIMVLNFPAYVATATSFFILSISALIGVVSHYQLGHVDLTAAIWLALGAIAGGQLGARVSQGVNGRLIGQMLAAALIFVGIRLIVK